MIAVQFEKETGETYWTDLEPDWPVRLTDGSILYVSELEPGDEIESHYSNETGGRGHTVISLA
jgi:hypothetical protein